MKVLPFLVFTFGFLSHLHLMLAYYLLMTLDRSLLPPTSFLGRICFGQGVILVLSLSKVLAEEEGYFPFQVTADLLESRVSALGRLKTAALKSPGWPRTFCVDQAILDPEICLLSAGINDLDGLELTAVHLPLPPEHWDERHTPLCPAKVTLNMSLACQKRASDPSIDGYESPCGCWELNSEPLEEQTVLLTAEPFLQPWFGFLRQFLSWLPWNSHCGPGCSQTHRDLAASASWC
uniref:Bm8147 n=1 Tax=Brugia malayi TaxID=6279 RepID=A0A1I9G697_BRUMA|nr:Bm8147 [Brugia malayi]